MEDIKYKINTFKASLFNFFSSFLALILAYKWLFKLQCFESMLRSEDKNQMWKKLLINDAHFYILIDLDDKTPPEKIPNESNHFPIY